MEKQAAVLPTDDPREPRPRKAPLRWRWPFIFATLLLAVWSIKPSHGTWFPLRGGKPSSTGKDKPFDWADLPVRTYLDYHDCDKYWGEDFQCARLELPMDYWNGTTDATVSIAIVKKPAAVPVTHPRYGGPILFNPGGPGGPGTGLVLAAADSFRDIIEDDNAKFFDYIGFDPRGVGESQPLIQCLQSSFLEHMWSVRVMEEGVFSASDAAFGRLYSIAKARMNSCSLPREDGKADIKQYATTASVARDMVEIIERHGEWREKEAERLLNEERSFGDRLFRSVEVPEDLKHHEGQEKINYWGFSYGTYLGNTFAAMFPDRINRLIVDGVVDAYDYKETIWMDNLKDTEKALDLFYYHCARVGYPTCALANAMGTTTADGVKERTFNILESLYHNPLPVIDRYNPDVITYSAMKQFIFGTLYGPIYGFPYLAKILAKIESGNFTEDAIAPGLYDTFSNTERAADSPFIGGMAVLHMDATVGIACTDGDPQGWLTRDEFREHVANLTKLSPAGGDTWAMLRLNCMHYEVRPFYRFEGPWVANTSHPLLEIGNTADPVTPGAYAKKMAKGFTGAVALIQDSPGHCSLAAPSKCTQGYVRQYFQTGELPPEDTVCEVDAIPFGPTPGDESALDLEVEELMVSSSKIARALYASGGGGFMNSMLSRNGGMHEASWK
ncbi:uncharacterized protein LTR77_002509 [Saxophila tyrrhenica]|uniref:Uncharacterized protein n=1 Tax=Saxophila tyrrhenica TaxID=1690608 RepID=A0AAV9PNJ9_9PEZI|nr:hypothetical protein LTR77_002509 [Saxophila tyrrhenica]